MYEHKKQPLASPKTFYRRVGKNLLFSMLIMALCLIIGTVGFKITVSPNPRWIDCFHNASMLLSGMGPVLTEIDNTTGKLFSSFYALFSGIAFITNIGIILAPIAHRFFHKLHLSEN